MDKQGKEQHQNPLEKMTSRAEKCADTAGVTVIEKAGEGLRVHASHGDQAIETECCHAR
jgi:hypothetical protein